MGFIPQKVPKNQPFGCFYLLYFTIMKNCKGLVISKGYLEQHYKKQYEKLNDLLGADWYIYQYYTIYYLVAGDCETSFVSLKLDLDNIVDGIAFGLLVSKHVK